MYNLISNSDKNSPTFMLEHYKNIIWQARCSQGAGTVDCRMLRRGQEVWRKCQKVGKPQSRWMLANSLGTVEEMAPAGGILYIRVEWFLRSKKLDTCHVVVNCFKFSNSKISLFSNGLTCCRASAKQICLKLFFSLWQRVMSSLNF